MCVMSKIFSELHEHWFILAGSQRFVELSFFGSLGSLLFYLCSVESLPFRSCLEILGY